MDFRPDAPSNYIEGVVFLDYAEGTAEFSFSGDMYDITYDVYDADEGTFLFSASWVCYPYFSVTTDMGLMGTIAGTTVTDPGSELEVTVTQTEADPMTDFDGVPG